MNTLKFGNSEWYGTEGNILAYNDENGNFKPLPFDFSRGSSATRVNKQGLIETVGANDARVDYKDNANGALLLEPTRTNYQPYSTDFSSWGVVDVTVGLNYGLSPNGFNNSVLLTEGTGSTQHRILKGSPTSSGIYTLSCFVKNKVGNRQAYIDMGAVTGFFNFDTKTMFSAAGTTSVESWSNGWYRISITSNTNVTPTANYLGIGKNNNETFQGDGSSAIEFFAPQLELGSYPTSIINTKGTAQTRLADSCTQTVPDGVIGQTEGTIYADVDFVGVNESITNQIFFIREENSNNGYLFAGFYQGKLNVGLKVSGSTKFDLLFGSILTKGSYKIAVVYSSGNTKVFVNGNQVGSTMTQTFGVNNFAQINSGTGSAGTNQLGDINRDLRVYNTALSDSEAIALTQV